MTKFTEADVGHHFTYKDTSNEWQLERIDIHDIIHWVSTDDPEKFIYTNLRGYPCNWNGSRLPDKGRIFTPLPHKDDIEATMLEIMIQDVGNEFTDGECNIWILDMIMGDGTLRFERKGERRITHADGIGWVMCNQNGTPDATAPTPPEWRIVAKLIKVDLREAIIGDSYADNKGDIWSFMKHDPKDGTCHFTHIDNGGVSYFMKTLQNGYAVVASKTLGPRRIVRKIPDVETITATYDEMKLTASDKARPALERIHDGEARPRSVLPTNALSYVQDLLVDPSRHPLHENLGVKAERFHLAHSLAAGLFRLERLLSEE